MRSDSNTDRGRLTDDEQAWMLELNRIGTEESLHGFPLHPVTLHGLNCWLEDYEAGLTPREAIETNRVNPPARKNSESTESA